MLEVELKIEDGKRKILERFQNIIENNYESNTSSERPIYDQAVLNLQAENFGATPESLEVDEEEEDHIIDDEDDEVICIDQIVTIMNISNEKVRFNFMLFENYSILKLTKVILHVM